MGEIIDIICANIHVLDELDQMIRLSNLEPDEHYQQLLEEKKTLLSKNVEKQRGLFQLYDEDKINLDLYREKAELLRNEEMRFQKGSAYIKG